jgi:hypothetical protein
MFEMTLGNYPLITVNGLRSRLTGAEATPGIVSLYNVI